jgi:hypothetical protein
MRKRVATAPAQVEERRKTWQYRLVWANTILVVLTLVAILWYTWVTSRTLEAAHRAWVLVDQVEKVDIQPGVQVGTVVRFKNFGNGPAFDVRQATAVHPPTTSTSLPTKPRPIPFGSGSTGAVPQGKDFSAPNVRIGGFDAATIEEIRKGRVKAYVYGRIDYRDEFSDRHTLFCRFLELHETKAGTTGVFSVCPGYDEAR